MLNSLPCSEDLLLPPTLHKQDQETSKISSPIARNYLAFIKWVIVVVLAFKASAGPIALRCRDVIQSNSLDSCLFLAYSQDW